MGCLCSRPAASLATSEEMEKPPAYQQTMPCDERPLLPKVTIIPSGVGPYLPGVPLCGCDLYKHPHMCTVCDLKADEAGNVVEVMVSETCSSSNVAVPNDKVIRCHRCFAVQNLLPLASNNFCMTCALTILRDRPAREAKWRSKFLHQTSSY